MTTWNEVADRIVPDVRGLYLAEVLRVAEALRPRFESGDLRGYTDEDLERDLEREGNAEGVDQGFPFRRLEKLCGEHFAASDEAALLVIVASPSASHIEDSCAAYDASYAAALDVLAVARACRWYTPAADEDRLDLDTTWVPRRAA